MLLRLVGAPVGGIAIAIAHRSARARGRAEDASRFCLVESKHFRLSDVSAEQREGSEGDEKGTEGGGRAESEQSS